MARYLTAPQQQIIPMSNPVNVEFYSNLLNKAQQDLERGTAIKAAAIEKYNDIPFLSKEDMDAVVGKAQGMLKDATEADFVSPSKVTNAVLSANAEVMPGVQAAKAKAKAADMYERMRLQYGPNFWGGTDPSTVGIVDKTTGRYVDPNTFKATGIDASEVDKLLLASQQQELNYSYDEPTKSDLPGYLKVNKYTGLSDTKRETLYKPNTASAIAIAKSQLATMPQLKEVFGSEEAALARLMERNYQTTGNYKQTIDSQYLTDRNYIDAETAARLKASQKDAGTPTVLFKPQDSDVEQNDIITDALNQRLEGSSTKMSASEISFDKEGRLNKYDMSVENVEPEIGSPTASTLSGFSTSPRTVAKISTQDRIKLGEKNIAQTKLITSIRKDLQSQGLNIIQDSKSNKFRARTDKEVYEFYAQATGNSANVFGKSFQINPGLDIIGANTFFYPDGRRKDFKDANIELNYNDGKGWQQVDETKLAEELGYDISDGKGVKEFNSTLRTLGSDSYDFMTGDTKIRSAMTNEEGKEVSIRYNAPPEVRDYKKPVAEMYNAFVKPVKDKKVYVGQDGETGKPIIITLNSKFASYRGSPVIYPEATIDQSTPSGQKYQEIYEAGGYEALLAEIQQSTDDAIINTGNAYVRKAVNTKDVPE